MRATQATYHPHNQGLGFPFVAAATLAVSAYGSYSKNKAQGAANEEAQKQYQAQQRAEQAARSAAQTNYNINEREAARNAAQTQKYLIIGGVSLIGVVVIAITAKKLFATKKPVKK